MLTANACAFILELGADAFSTSSWLQRPELNGTRKGYRHMS